MRMSNLRWVPIVENPPFSLSTPGATPGGAAKPSGAGGAVSAGGIGTRSVYCGVEAQPAAGNQSVYFAVGAYNNPAATDGVSQAAPISAIPAPTSGGASTMTAVGGMPPPNDGQSVMATVGGLPMTRRIYLTAVGAVTPADGGGRSTMTAVGAVPSGGGQSMMTAVRGAPTTGQSTMTAVRGPVVDGGQSMMTAVRGTPMTGQSTMTAVRGPVVDEMNEYERMEFLYDSPFTVRQVDEHRIAFEVAGSSRDVLFFEDLTLHYAFLPDFMAGLICNKVRREVFQDGQWMTASKHKLILTFASATYFGSFVHDVLKMQMVFQFQDQ